MQLFKKKKLQNIFDGTESQSQPRYPPITCSNITEKVGSHYISITHMFTSGYKFSTHNIVMT